MIKLVMLSLVTLHRATQRIISSVTVRWSQYVVAMRKVSQESIHWYMKIK